MCLGVFYITLKYLTSIYIVLIFIAHCLPEFCLSGTFNFLRGYMETLNNYFESLIFLLIKSEKLFKNIRIFLIGIVA